MNGSGGFKRHTIWERDDFFLMCGQRIDMDPSVVIIPAGAPLTWNYDWDRSPVGRCFDIRLENGAITCNVLWNEPGLNDDTPEDLGVRFGGQYYEVVRGQDVMGREIVKHCVLKGVSLFIREPAIPKGMMKQ